LYPNVSAGDIIVVEVGNSVLPSYIVSATIDERAFGEAQVPVSLVTIGSVSAIGQPAQNAAIRIWFDARKAGTIERIPTLTVNGAHMLNIPCPVTLSTGSSLPTADTNIIIQDAEGTAIPAEGG